MTQDHGRRVAQRQTRGPCRSSPVRSAASASITKRPPPSGSTTRCRRSWTGSTASNDLDPVSKAALAHLWFVTIHPFDDGNGRIARAIADLALARSENSAQRFYSMSAQIRAGAERLLRHSRSDAERHLDITPWLEWFLGCLDRAFDGAETILGTVLHKARFLGDTYRQLLQ